MSNRLTQRIKFGTTAGIALPPPPATMRAWMCGDAVSHLLARPDRLRVAIVDDDRDTVDTMAMLVELWGHEVRPAYSAADGFALVDDAVPDVLFTDITMPAMDGVQMARLLRRQARCADMLLVALTGWADAQHRRLWETAFDHYLIKPVATRELETLLQERVRLVQSRTAGCRGLSRSAPGLFFNENPTCSD